MQEFTFETFALDVQPPLKKKIDESQHQHLVTWGKALLGKKDYAGALLCLQETKKINADFETSYLLGQCLDKMNLPLKAKEEYLDALLAPTASTELLFETYKNLGNLFLKEKKLDMAEDFYNKALCINPESAQLFVNLAALEMQKDNSQKTLDYYRKALSIDTRLASGWIGLALSYQQFGDHEMAWASLLKALDLEPHNHTALLLLSQWCHKNSQQDFALEKLMNHFDQGDFDSTLSLAFIELCVKLDQFTLARWELERSLLWEPQNKDLLKFDRALANYGH